VVNCMWHGVSLEQRLNNTEGRPSVRHTVTERRGVKCGRKVAVAIIASIIIIISSFMQRIYTYIPETNHVPKEYNVSSILSLLVMAHLSLVPALLLFSLLLLCPCWLYNRHLHCLD
jgi:hypothetical protein